MTLFVHDCESCKWLGTFAGADLYMCNTFIIARFSDEDGDYASINLAYHPDYYDHGLNPYLCEAARRYMVRALQF
jgi:hypothetical protein